MTTAHVESANAAKRFAVVPWGQINEAGAYVSNTTGRLFRIPESAVKQGHSPVIEILGPEGEEMVTCLSRNAYTPLEKLRQLCADANIEPQF